MDLREPIDKLARRTSHELRDEERAGRIRAYVDEVAVLDTTRGRMLHETGSPPRLYAPVEDYRREVLVESEKSTHCPFKGDANYWSLRVGDRTIEDAVWRYEEPKESMAWLEGYAALYADKVDRIEEG